MASAWYKDAVFYEVHTRAFKDGNGDGIGDFHGLRENLGYIRDLGVSCLWLLPMYPSPLRDGGYDIADYCAIHPDLGTMQDFEDFLATAHTMGIRVIADLVMNHTSSEHPWFKASAADPSSPYRDYYVWSDTPEKFREARVIFCDTEPSNWTYHPQARAYYWHRFYAHQPDLNFDNPAVREEMLRVADFWLGLGLDGFRVDAIPYLFEREGTNCENLPETHDYCRELRAFVDRKYPDALLLAEANQWPQDVAKYLGHDDEFHMAFNFPLMPRLFMGVRREDATPIREIMECLPTIPENCQWAMFLRNHDELSLEMVTDEERDYMYREYAKEPRIRLNLGIRRRLFPLMEDNVEAIKMLHSILFTLPGSPVLYYGDEIGMGDNIYLGDRDGVRTPMQWTGDRNAGFSGALPSRLFLPVISDPGYHFQGMNVEAQSRSPSSFLNWMRGIVRVRQSQPAFGRGSMRFVEAGNHRVLCYLRQWRGTTILVVNNVARSPQWVMLDLREFNGCVPVDLFSRTPFPPIGELPYLLTLGPHGFYWIEIQGQQH